MRPFLPSATSNDYWPGTMHDKLHAASARCRSETTRGLKANRTRWHLVDDERIRMGPETHGRFLPRMGLELRTRGTCSKSNFPPPALCRFPLQGLQGCLLSALIKENGVKPCRMIIPTSISSICDHQVYFLEARNIDIYCNRLLRPNHFATKNRRSRSLLCGSGLFSCAGYSKKIARGRHVTEPSQTDRGNQLYPRTRIAQGRDEGIFFQAL